MPEQNRPESGDNAQTTARAPVIDMAKLQSVSELGFVGGRDSFRDFCLKAFAYDEPRFFRTDDNDLVVFRHADLRALGAVAAIANVPPGVMFPGLTLEAATCDLPPEGQRPLGLTLAGILSNQFFTMNPPIHGPVRKLLVNQLGPKQVAQMENLARETIRGLIDDFPTGQVVDFAAEFCEKLTARFFGTLLGMTDEEKIGMARAVREINPLFYMDRKPEDLELLDKGSGLFRELIETATLRTLASGLSPMLTAMAEGLAKLDFEEDIDTVGIVPRNIGAFMAGNLVDAFHTAGVGACNTLYTLLHQPEALAQIQKSPELMPRAVFEALRLEPPVIFLRRYMLEDVEYAGVTIPKGILVAMLWSAGNHDPKVFPDPDKFDMNRSHSGVTTFGGGIHICPGRYVSVMLARIMLEVLKEKGVHLELVDAPYEWYAGHLMGQLKTMPVRVCRETA